MQRSSRAVASAAVVAGLGGLAAIALGSQPGRRRVVTVTPRVVVRTQTDVHTITRVKRDLPPLTSPQTVRPAGPAPRVAVTPVVAPATARIVPVVQRAPRPAPLRSRTSGGAGAGHGDDGSEGAGRKEREGDGQDD